MNIPPLCIIQARLNSARLRDKMLLDFGGETLIARAWRLVRRRFPSFVVAIPGSDEAGPLGEELRRLGAEIFAWGGFEDDVLGRFYHCAHAYRWHPDSVIVRWTPDDPFKDADLALRVAENGCRLPVEQGGEAFTLAMLDAAHARCADTYTREHITHAIFPTPPPPCPPGIWTVDTAEDLEAARARLVEGQNAGRSDAHERGWYEWSTRRWTGA